MYTIRQLELSDVEALADYVRRNEEYLRPWSPIPPPGFFEPEFQRGRIERYLKLRQEGGEYRFGIFDGDVIIGSISMTAVERGPFQNARFGYSIDGEHSGRGVMTASLQEVIRFAFDEQHLHRLEANVMPRNIPSRRVLEKCGFQKIGHAPEMLMIAGVWEGHDMYALLAPNA